MIDQQPTNPITESSEPAYDVNDPKLIAAAGILVEYLLELLAEPDPDTAEGGDAA